ncbi:MAG: 50S ribosomal protein L10 [bacterium]
MPLTRQQKEQSVSEVQNNMASAASVVFLNFDHLNVEEVGKLRSNLYEAGGGMRVIPKRLLKIALSNLKLDFDPMQQEGQVAIVWGDDAVAPAKTLNEFALEHKEKIRFLAGILEGNILSLAEVIALAKLPSRQQLLGQLASVMAGPARGFVTVLSGVQRKTVQILKAVADQKQNT